MYRILIITALSFVIFSNQQSHAQSKETVDTMLACLHKIPFPTEISDGDEHFQCVSKTFKECDELDLPGGFGEGELTAENCYLSVVAQIKSKMYSHLENGWPDKNSTAYQLRKLAIDYGIERSELKCEFEGALMNISNKPWLGEVDQFNLNLNNRFAALCLSGFIAANYWTIIVHERIR